MEKILSWYSAVFEDGALTTREKALIGLAVAHAVQSPYCIDSLTQTSLEKDYKRELDRKFGIKYNSLYTITNMPINRYLDYLITSGNYESYMSKLISAFNPVAAANVMCRNTISVSRNGYLYDCDFNQMLEMKVNHSAPNHIRDFNFQRLKNRIIATGQHCYGCTAGAGSSCGGSLA